MSGLASKTDTKI